MSKIGRNIKKIRSIKKINQNEFANIFGISRASVGAYEEGRAEPKIETIINISNHFKIEVDKLLKSDLQVNDISGFKLSNSKFDVLGNNLTTGRKLNIRDITLYSTSTKKIKRKVTLSLPVEHSKKEYIALNDNNISICFKSENPESYLNRKIFIETENSYILDTLIDNGETIAFKDNDQWTLNDFPIYIIESEILPVKNEIRTDLSIEERISKLERKIFGVK